MPNKTQKSPASAFLIMAGFNALGTVAFLVFYFLYKSWGGNNSYLFLVAAGVAGFASAASFVLFKVFKKKLEGIRRL